MQNKEDPIKKTTESGNTEFVFQSMYTIKELLKIKNFAELYALYSYYTYKVLEKKSEFIKIPTTNVIKDLKWSIEKINKYKKILVSIGLIKILNDRSFGNGRFLNQQIEVKSYPFSYYEKARTK
ncbi:MAG: hypothetical protein WC516_06690 [Patescibacteria group bacterium]|jgi:hypothetical protein